MANPHPPIVAGAVELITTIAALPLDADQRRALAGLAILEAEQMLAEQADHPRIGRAAAQLLSMITRLANEGPPAPAVEAPPAPSDPGVATPPPAQPPAGQEGEQPPAGQEGEQPPAGQEGEPSDPGVPAGPAQEEPPPPDDTAVPAGPAQEEPPPAEEPNTPDKPESGQAPAEAEGDQTVATPPAEGDAGDAGATLGAAAPAAGRPRPRRAAGDNGVPLGQALEQAAGQLGALAPVLAATAPAARGRGRPRKDTAAAAAEGAPSDKSVATLEAPAAARGRGRPRRAPAEGDPALNQLDGQIEEIRTTVATLGRFGRRDAALAVLRAAPGPLSQAQILERITASGANVTGSALWATLDELRKGGQVQRAEAEATPERGPARPGAAGVFVYSLAQPDRAE